MRSNVRLLFESLLFMLIVLIALQTGCHKTEDPDNHGEHEKQMNYDGHDEHKDHDEHDDHEKEEHDEHDEHGDEDHKHKDHDEHEKLEHKDHDDNGKDKHDDHSEHDDNDDEKKAVVEKDLKKGIILLPEAIKNIGVISVPVKRLRVGYKLYRVPVSSLVYYEDRVCVLYKRGEWYNRTDVKVVKKNKNSAVIYTGKIKNHDNITTEGAALLCLAYLEAFGASGYGHVH